MIDRWIDKGRLTDRYKWTPGAEKEFSKVVRLKKKQH